jgi:hypothetical protein
MLHQQNRVDRTTASVWIIQQVFREALPGFEPVPIQGKQHPNQIVFRTASCQQITGTDPASSTRDTLSGYARRTALIRKDQWLGDAAIRSIRSQHLLTAHCWNQMHRPLADLTSTHLRV